jgi:hypothetical protein
VRPRPPRGGRSSSIASPADGISADEHVLLTVVAALQAGRRGHATALLEWLLHEGAAHAATSPAATLAAALEESGIVLPLRPTHGTTTLSADEKRTGALH